MFLFIDTTKYITVGLLDLNCNWVDYQFISSKKSSSELHPAIYEILKKQNIEMKDLDAIIYAAGPGSYTGMRVGQGFVETCSLFEIPFYSFYHFEVPALSGIDEGEWIDEAFKGEYFVYKWNHAGVNKYLVSKKDYKASEKNIFTGFERGLLENIELTKELIYKNAKKVVSSIINNKVTKELYYYRSIEEEFTK